MMELNDILDFDNDVIKNNFVIKEHDLLIWPLIRWDVLYKIEQIRDGMNDTHAKQPILSLRNFRYAFHTTYFAPHKKKNKFEIVFYVPARGRLNNKNFNVYSDYYSFLTKKTLVIDSAFRGVYIIPENIESFATGDYGRLKSFLFAKIKNFFLKKQNLDIEKIMNFLNKKNLFEKDFYEKNRKKIYEYYFSYDSYKSYHSKVLCKLDPKIILVTIASYGQYEAILVKTAKDLGIVTGEFQHGVISKGHLAYNYGNEVIKSREYKKYLPDYVLTYGDYWNEQMTIPCKAVTIGAPHFYNSIKKYEHVVEKKKMILIVSQGDITHKFVKIARYLAETLLGYTIIFKLHPGEVPFEDRYKVLYKYKNIIVAKSGDIYEHIAECETIVAHNSTTIFEAMGFNKNIFILDDEASKSYIPKDIGIRFKEKEELKELIKNNEKQNFVYNVDYYFNPNWKENYEIFLSETVGIT